MTETNIADAEAERAFEKEKTIFEQDCQEFRSLNGFLWQIPVIVSTLTGGLWFGAAKLTNESAIIQSWLFLLAGVVNLCFVIVLWRLRAGVMEPLLERITAYQGRGRNSRKYLMIWMFTILLVFSSLFSFFAFLLLLRQHICKV
jgi:hypothetical protein